MTLEVRLLIRGIPPRRRDVESRLVTFPHHPDETDAELAESANRFMFFGKWRRLDNALLIIARGDGAAPRLAGAVLTAYAKEGDLLDARHWLRSSDAYPPNNCCGVKVVELVNRSKGLLVRNLPV